MITPTFTIDSATGAEDIDAVRLLFRSYAASLDVDLAYQGFAAELGGLPGAYASPAGALLLARSSNGEPLGCVALRPMSDADCAEMKRLYVDPSARGLGIGRVLVTAVIEAAREAAYREVRLDTLPSMIDAQDLYHRLGFVPMDPYYETPIIGTRFMRLVLK